MIFGGEAEGVFEVEVTGGDGRVVDGTGDGAEGSVIIVCRDAITGFKVDEFRDVLIAIKGVEELVVARGRKHKQWACGEGFGWIQAKRTRSQLFSNRYAYFRLNLFILISFMRFRRIYLKIIDSLSSSLGSNRTPRHTTIVYACDPWQLQTLLYL